MSYSTFRRIPLVEQKKNKDTQARRLIEFDDEEKGRAERREISPITGLTSGCKLLLMLNSPDVVDWRYSEFVFDIIVLTEEEFNKEK